ncbi:hypothetical protein [Holospora curviuscula]|uniref:Uncharacterized protein n=1 Tax=Holospora curviuscula TaxID=1082868 RepID=A0A2S5RAF0_9PROT|nr:hypothetical protein [Holospora curviuscula]PPE04288.1 hypothetical protein HCUR_00479 [Holospora curviuscula]
MSMLGQYYRWYVLGELTADKKIKNPDWQDCTRYLAGFLMKVLLLNEWREYDYPKYDWTYKFADVADDFWGLFEWGKDISGKNIDDIVDREKEHGRDHYPGNSLMNYIAETTIMGDSINADILECIAITNDLFIGRRSSDDMYNAFMTHAPYDPNIKWPCHPHHDTLCPSFHRAIQPYLQSQDPPRSQAVIWVPFPILRFAFFAKEVALFGRSFDGMQRVAQEQLEQLDSRLIHPEYFYILARVLELEDTPESRNSLDILANNLFLGEKPLTQAWVEGPEEVPWLR